jgi:hypothetical protein
MAKRSKPPSKKASPRRTPATTTRAIELETENKTTFMIEIGDPPEIVGEAFEGGTTVGGTAAEKAIANLKDIGAAIADVCQSIQEEVEEAMEEAVPNELTLEFGVKLTGETGIPMLTKVSAEGTLKVTAKWNLKK